MNEKRFDKEKQWLLQEKYQGKVTPTAKKDLARLRAGEPVDYVIGFVEFAECSIDLSFLPLIPRPETEYWTQKAIDNLSYNLNIRSNYKTTWKNDVVRCLDMFAGSGCIGIAVLKHIPKARVDFAEKEKKFLRQVRLNLKKNRIPSSRARVIQSNVFSNVKGTYDCILANPPYVAASRWKSVQSSVAKYEPKEALIAGKDGLLYVRKLLKEAKNHLAWQGTIYMEFDSPQKKEVEQLLEKYGYSSWEFHKDQYGKWRFVVASPWPG